MGFGDINTWITRQWVVEEAHRHMFYALYNRTLKIDVTTAIF
jgi:hypothetical protein